MLRLPSSSPWICFSLCLVAVKMKLTLNPKAVAGLGG
jgi:hypothetical protein